MRKLKIILLASIAFVLISCGGGASNGDTKPKIPTPIANADTLSIKNNQTQTILVLQNDSGTEIKIKSADISSKNAGAVSVNSSASAINYTPKNNFIGTDSFNYVIVDKSGKTATAKVTITVTQSVSHPFSLVTMHHGLLNNHPMTWEEYGADQTGESILNIQLSQAATKGSQLLNIQTNTDLVAQQLVVYYGTDGQYYVAQVQQVISLNQIKLFKPLEASINAGNNVWSFYGNPSHPNRYGYRSIIDYAIRSLSIKTNTQEKHLLLGDSWFESSYTEQRLQQRLPSATVINAGIGGDSLQEMINRFDNDVTPHHPNTIWIISGTNDYWYGVSKAQFKANLKTLINKSKAIGAKVIVIDSSVSDGEGPMGIDIQKRSEEYAAAAQALYEGK